jgi:putative sterol carrier protein
MAFDPQTLHGLPPQDFVALVKRTPDQEMAADFAGEHREAMLDSVFARFPQQFRPDKAGDRSARIDFRITGGPDGSSDTYAVVVENGECRIDKHPSVESDLSLTMGPPEFLKLVTGNGNPAMMFMMGKIKARGDVGLATGLATWFDSPS